MVRKLKLRVPVVHVSPQEKRVVLSLYRSLLRLAGKFDGAEPAKALLFRSSYPKNLDCTTGDGYYNTVVDRIFDKALLWAPEKLSFSLSDVIKSEFRKQKDISLDIRMQGAFKGIRKFSSVWSTYDKAIAREGEVGVGQQEPMLPPRTPAAAVCQPFTGFDRVFSGVVLAAHPLVHGPLSRSVVLILQHDSNGSYGVVINHRSQKQLSEVVQNLPSDILDVFRSNPTHYGGPTKRLQSIHKFPNLDGSKFVMPSASDDFGIYTGGMTKGNLEKLAAEVKAAPEGPHSKDSFYFFTGCCTWNGGELQNQLAAGYWSPMILSADDVWSLIEQVQPAAAKDTIGDTEPQAQEAVKPNDGKVDYLRISSSIGASHPDDRTVIRGPDSEEEQSMYMTPGGRSRNRGWAWLMTAAGYPHSGLSSFPFVDVQDITPLD